MSQPANDPTVPEGISVWGMVETAYRNWVGNLDDLSARQKALAEQVFRLASLMDTEEGGAQSASLSRELRQAADSFRESASAASPKAPSNDVDEVAKKRADRRGQERGA